MISKRSPLPPLLGLALEITKELSEVIITVISSQRRQPQNGKGRGQHSGEKLSKPLSQQGARDPSSGCCSPGQVSWVDLFFLSVGYPEIALQVSQRRMSATSFPRAQMSKDRKRELKREKEKRRENKEIQKKKREIKTLKPFIVFVIPLKGVESLGRASIASQSSDGRAGLQVSGPLLATSEA